MTARTLLILCLGLTVVCVATAASAFAPVDEVALCAQSGGQWEECGSGCGPFTCDNLPDPEQACPFMCVAQCDCPADHVFDFGVGCLPISECEGGGGAPIPPPPEDMDGDEQTAAQGDCDDSDPEVYKGAEELCDEKDNDCDTEIDEGCDVEPLDSDGDGYAADVDCDDNNTDSYPGAEEICDLEDNDCDGDIDEGCDVNPVDSDGDGYAADVDCNDNNAASFPGADEVCDLEDNDCDGDIDEGCDEEPGEPMEFQLICEDTGGTYTCSDGETPCAAPPCLCDESCACPQGTSWDEVDAEGCVADEGTECPEGNQWDGDACVESPTGEHDLCESTGGAIPGCMPCGVPVTCGVAPASEEECMVAGCLPGGCLCPSEMLFDADAGCVPQDDCAGQDEPSESSRDDEDGEDREDSEDSEDSAASTGTSSSGCQAGGDGSSPWGLMLLLALSGLGLMTRVGRAGEI